jgi:hypothetical protein
LVYAPHLRGQQAIVAGATLSAITLSAMTSM